MQDTTNISWNIEQQKNLRDFTTFGTSCIAKYFIRITNAEQIETLWKNYITPDTPYIILGGWSNTLLSQDAYPGRVIHNNILGTELIYEDTTTAHIRVWWWVNWDTFVQWTIQQGYAWLENLISIPWSVWAAPVQNIGAYGAEISEHIHTVEGYYLQAGKHPTSKDTPDAVSKRTFDAAACQFQYRDSIFKNELKSRFFITHVTFVLQKYTPDTYQPVLNYPDIQQRLQDKQISPKDLTPAKVAEAIANIRAKKFPDLQMHGTAGSFFKNIVVDATTAAQLQHTYPHIKTFTLPDGNVKIPTWRIIEHLVGYKGKRHDAVGCREHQALVITNYHRQASWQEILAFTQFLQEQIHQKCWLHVEPEVNIITEK